MRSTLDDFLADINELNVFVESVQGVYSALAGHEESVVRNCLNIRRRLDYAAFVIYLYAAFEKFVDDLAWSHTELESSRNKYSELYKSLRSKHLRQSADLLNRGHLGEGRFAGVSEMDIIENLHACLSGKNPYTLNRHAVIHHNYNLRSQVVQGLFSALGIKNINGQASRVKTMIDWFCAAEGLEATSREKIPDRVVEFRLKDLVDRRNQVSHAGRDLAESLNVSEMRERLGFLEAYARSLFDVLAHHYLDRYYIRSGKAKSLGKPIEGPYHDGFVVVVSKPRCRVFRGQPIIGVRKNRVDRWGEIRELEVDDVQVESIEPDSEATSAGLLADFKFTKGIEVYALEAKDKAVWG